MKNLHFLIILEIYGSLSLLILEKTTIKSITYLTQRNIEIRIRIFNPNISQSFLIKTILKFFLGISLSAFHSIQDFEEMRSCSVEAHYITFKPNLKKDGSIGG
jgi:hypothetical protein